jgi:hypothetical protein
MFLCTIDYFRVTYQARNVIDEARQLLLSSVFPWYMNATSLFVVTLSLLGELGQESSADAIL